MAEKYPDNGCLTFPPVDEDTKQNLLNGTWPSYIDLKRAQMFFLLYFIYNNH